MKTHIRAFTSVSAILALIACSSDSKKSTAETYLGLSTPTDGFQIRDLGEDIAPGADSEYCEVGQLPGSPSDTYYVTSLEFGNGDHSHHLIVTAAVPGGPAEPKLAALGVGNRVPCLGAQIQFGEAGFVGVGGSQSPYNRLDYPAGVGVEYHGGQYVVFDYHYLNTTDKPVHALSAVNFHLADKSKVQHIGQQFGFYNFTIDTPAGKTGSFVGECHFKQDVKVGGVVRHTHRWGTDYSVWYSGGAEDGQKFWTSTDWEHDVNYGFDAPLVMKAGEGFRFQCDYNNDTKGDLRFGTSASDEMCILFGLMWEANDGEQLANQDCAITWVDANGVGHPADEAGGFPKPSSTETALCTQGLGSGISACGQCYCDNCATPIIQCATDAECKAVLSCFQSCTSGDCQAECQSVIDEHSSAVGPLMQVQSCTRYACPACGSGAPKDAGTSG